MVSCLTLLSNTSKNFCGSGTLKVTPSTADQEPIVQFTTGTQYSLILEPTKLDVRSLGGLISSSTKKFVFEKDTSIQVSDVIIFSSGTFQAIETQDRLTRTVVFANRFGNS